MRLDGPMVVQYYAAYQSKEGSTCLVAIPCTEVWCGYRTHIIRKYSSFFLKDGT